MGKILGTLLLLLLIPLTIAFFAFLFIGSFVYRLVFRKTSPLNFKVYSMGSPPRPIKRPTGEREVNPLDPTIIDGEFHRVGTQPELH